MKKRPIYKILLLALILILIVTSVFIFSNDNQKSEVTTIGENVNGSVQKITTGNLGSEDTAVIILGVHPREHEVHEALNATMKNITSTDNNLTKRFIIYYIVVNDNITSRNETRAAGEQLANQFIVPDIKNETPFLVTDVHEIDRYYEYPNFIEAISNNTVTQNYIKNISKDIGIRNFDFKEGTSPELVTKPIANQGLNTILFEVSITYKMEQKKEQARKLIYAIDNLERV
ncbi:hypothetical protein [uncultured Methanobrevibacter sp.]|mgnify:FL=1|uniref:hypothetical protein n=1 Tax=uncultured Methanobrevibacter sp. TaxID=253161 RepID=UPI0015BB680E|nr:hypothetical protein [uncultured Methanobrevibacter sp.]